VCESGAGGRRGQGAEGPAEQGGSADLWAGIWQVAPVLFGCAGEAAHSLCLQCRVLLSLELHLSRAVPSFSPGSLGQLTSPAALSLTILDPPTIHFLQSTFCLPRTSENLESYLCFCA
jgi:hypothetical protein